MTRDPDPYASSDLIYPDDDGGATVWDSVTGGFVGVETHYN